MCRFTLWIFQYWLTFLLFPIAVLSHNNTSTTASSPSTEYYDLPFWVYIIITVVTCIVLFLLGGTLYYFCRHKIEKKAQTRPTESVSPASVKLSVPQVSVPPPPVTPTSNLEPSCVPVSHVDEGKAKKKEPPPPAKSFIQKYKPVFRDKSKPKEKKDPPKHSPAPPSPKKSHVDVVASNEFDVFWKYQANGHGGSSEVANIDWADVGQSFEVIENFWEMFPFIKVSHFVEIVICQGDHGGLNDTVQFCVRDVSKSEFQVFRSFAARLFEPLKPDSIAPEIRLLALPEADRAFREPYYAIRVFLLNDDPPIIECHVTGRAPYFFLNIIKCDACQADQQRLKLLAAADKLADALRELPAGHHTLTGLHDPANPLDSSKWRLVYLIKGGEPPGKDKLKYERLFHVNGASMVVKKALKEVTSVTQKSKTSETQQQSTG